MKKREKILHVSREMFNEQGYWQVTIRMIAQKLEMSSGNLNYHFKKREDILEALYFQMVEEFDQRIERLPNVEISLDQVKKDILMSMDRMIHYKFIWTDLYRLMNGHEKLYVHFSEAYRRRLEGSLFLYQRLQQLGIMEERLTESELRLLAERMIHFGDTWIYCSEVYRTKQEEISVEEQCHKMLMILEPYMTEKGKEAFQSVID